jgi:cell division inhibitor SepF
MGSVQAVPAVPGSKPQLVAPRSFNDAQEVADRFRGGAPVILNLRETDAELGRRLIDFCSGLCYGLRGQMQRVGDRVFLVTPADVQLSADDHRLMRESGLFG